MSRSFPNLSSHSPYSHSPHTHSPNSPAQSQVLSQSLSHQLNLLTAAEQEQGKWADPQTWDCTVPSTLPKVVSRLRTCLEDIQGQFPQLHSLEEAVLELHDMCKQCRSRRDSNTSEISLSVESALECFDFLNAECDDDFADDNPEECLAKNQKESLVVLNGKDFSEPPPVLVTSSAQLDAFLLIHLQHSLHLIQDLGSFGPLRKKETESLIKLEDEGKLLEIILSHRHNFDTLRPQHIMPIPHLQVLWDSVTSGEDWCVSGKAVVNGLLPVVSSLLEPDDHETPIKVLEELVRQMTDSEIYSDCLTVTAGHFLAHLVKPLQETVPHISASLNCSSLLAQRDPNSIEKGLSLLKIPNVLHTKLISQHFLGPLEYSSLVTSYINKIKNIDEALSALFDNCLLLLESTSPSERSAASTLLGHIFPLLPSKKEEKSNKDNKNEIIKEGKNSNDDAILDVKETPKTNDDKKESSSIGQNDNVSISKSIPNPIHKIPKRNDFAHPIAILSFLQQNDPSQEVRNSARLSLLNLGSQGQEALHQVQLSSHGFQGLAVKEGREKTKT
ncbi:Protein FAM65A [Armadillidium nasatum]|uniref:Protein FAM65A n=1 Tax=Armadillidium nasatum TaxID=96803 RepID=A0A5N5TL85_9CRUS|nr:Protein FAM65A [Armadillidium nasatum]